MASNICSDCAGSGKCSKCDGKGSHDSLDQAHPEFRRPCRQCHCTGRCHVCHGDGKPELAGAYLMLRYATLLADVFTWQIGDKAYYAKSRDAAPVDAEPAKLYLLDDQLFVHLDYGASGRFVYGAIKVGD